MDEEEFDSLRPWRPFGTEDALRLDAQSRRTTQLATALWGTADDLERQLAGPHPEIPAGFELDDFRALQKSIQAMAALSGNPRFKWLGSSMHLSGWAARCEILRRAIEFLEG